MLLKGPAAPGRSITNTPRGPLAALDGWSLLLCDAVRLPARTLLGGGCRAVPDAVRMPGTLMGDTGRGLMWLYEGSLALQLANGGVGSGDCCGVVVLLLGCECERKLAARALARASYRQEHIGGGEGQSQHRCNPFFVRGRVDSLITNKKETAG